MKTASRTARVSLLLAPVGLLSLLALSIGERRGVRADTPRPTTIDFNKQIRPILSENCFACHGPDEKQRKAKLRLDTKEGALGKLRHGGFAIVPGKPDESAMITRISSHDPNEIMPPPKSRKSLKPEQIALLKQWVEQGAPWTEHWAFVAPKKSELPKVRNPLWERNPIDAFILARLEAEGLNPSPEAAKTTLLRRVTLDLTGLPPTPEEVDAFLADRSPDAYEKVVDRLLASSRYGEHMARYWLDAARYGDTHGLHLDNYREIWPYREWVIKAFNANKPYDQFVIEQLAGDLLPDATLDQIVATGYNRCHVSTAEGGSIEEEVYVRNVLDQVETNGIVFLGLTIGCARCHDHKYDPITQKDFYQLFAFFNSIDGPALDGNAARWPPVVKVATPQQKLALEKAEQRIADLKRTIREEVAKVPYDASVDAKESEQAEQADPASAGAPTPQVGQSFDTLTAWVRAQKAAKGAGLPKPIQDIIKLERDKRQEAQKKQLLDYFLEHAYSKRQPTLESLNKQLAEAQKERDELDKQIPSSLVFKERSEPRPAYILKRGEYDQHGEQVGRDVPAFLPPLPPDAPRNRLGLARWLVAPENPLTARVEVNRLWQQVFGTGLVKTSEDFGSQGEPPSHARLLDWLAVQFREDGWDIKKMLKRIVTSATYRQASRVTKDRLAKDPANRLLSRGPRFRLDAEELRDQALFVSGLLVERIGGPSVKPPQPAGLWEAVGYTGSNTVKFVADTTHEKVHRRSLYTFWKRTSAPPQMTIADAPSREACTVRRERTDTPLQALMFMNETQFVEAARHLAERAIKQGGDTSEARIAYLFKLATARLPEECEKAELLAAYRDHLAAFQRDEPAARKLIAVGAMKPDASLNPSELAAWTMVANLVLNLDEVLNKG